jgi:hypothetical protein
MVDAPGYFKFVISINSILWYFNILFVLLQQNETKELYFDVLKWNKEKKHFHP